MPTIAIRAHGVSASKFQQVVNPETGEIVKLTAFQPPERTATRGWTVNVARRNEQRLQQVDFDAVDGFPAFVTLTMPSQQMSDVSAAMFHGWLKSWLRFMKRHGMNHYYWILEFQASGNPHLHVLVWLDHEPEPLQGSAFVGRHFRQIRRRRSAARPNLGINRRWRHDYRGRGAGACASRTCPDVFGETCRSRRRALSTADNEYAGRLAMSFRQGVGSRPWLASPRSAGCAV